MSVVSLTESEIGEYVSGCADIFQFTGREYIFATTETHYLQLYKGNFGISPYDTARIWVLMQQCELLPEKGKAKHLLWTLFFLRKYLTEDTMEIILHANRKTIRTWINKFTIALRNLAVDHLVSTHYLILLIFNNYS